jgi:hypothetical protein
VPVGNSPTIYQGGGIFPDFESYALRISAEDVSSNGSGTGIAASSHRRSTLKETKVSNFYDYFK